MEFTDRLDWFEGYVIQKQKAGWILLTRYYKDWANFECLDGNGNHSHYIHAEIDFTGKIYETKLKNKPKDLSL